MDRLTEAKETNNGTQTWKQTFGYDRYGNRTSFTQIIGSTQLPINNETLPTVDPNTNRFQTSQGYTYDFNGNLVGDAEGRQFVFNADNKQTQVKDSQNNVVGQYYYDGNGKRIKKITAQETVTFVYSGGKLVAEYSTQTQQAQATTKYVTTDTLGSIRAITDQNANIVSRRDFMPFGEDLYAGTPNRTTNDGYKVVGDSVRQKFTGYERDEETGLDFAEARYYKNNHGRFTAVDPLLASGKSANPQTFNRYVYVMNAPLKYTDPTGLFANCPTCANGERVVSDDGRTGTWSTDGTPGTGAIASVEVSSDMTVEEAQRIVNFSNDLIKRNTRLASFLQGFRSVGEPALPILEVIQPTPLPAFSALAGIFKIGRVSQRSYGVAKTIEAVEKVTEASKAAADAAQLLPNSVKGQTAGALLTVDNNISFGGSVVKKFKTVLHPKVKKIYDKIPKPKRGKGHPNCAEGQCVTNSLNRNQNVNNGLINTRLVRSKGHPDHGKIIKPCPSCEILLEKLNITSIP